MTIVYVNQNFLESRGNHDINKNSLHSLDFYIELSTYETYRTKRDTRPPGPKIDFFLILFIFFYLNV